jgi:hypothetical protein
MPIIALQPPQMVLKALRVDSSPQVKPYFHPRIALNEVLRSFLPFFKQAS